jgi:SAM-dependent methyltransferase
VGLRRRLSTLELRAGPRRPPPRGGLASLEPVSRSFGFERGLPVDRWYIERFLRAHAADIRGRVLEVQEPAYTQMIGGDRVEHSEVLHAAPGNPEATLVGDLVTGEGIPDGEFDCFVCTQTLQFIYDLPAAVAGTRRALRDGGVLLASVPGITQISRVDRERWGEYWRFTAQAVSRLFGDVYGAANVTVEAHGNVLAAACFLYGYAAEDLSEAELAHRDPDYELIVMVRAVR